MGRFADIANELTSQMNELVSRLTDIANEEFDTADEDAYREYAVVEKETVQRIFADAVSSFYNAYSPMFYNREGDSGSQTGGLFDILDIQEDEYGMVSTEASGYVDLFNEANSPTDKEGNSLYEQVFMQGWHGGAIGTDKRGVSVSTPHYRTPYDKYYRWGREAVKTQAPAAIFARNYAAADSGELQREFDRIIDKHTELAHARITARQADLEREIFG